MTLPYMAGRLAASTPARESTVEILAGLDRCATQMEDPDAGDPFRQVAPFLVLGAEYSEEELEDLAERRERDLEAIEHAERHFGEVGQ